MSGGTDPAFFDGLYAGNPDPWGFETSAYEQEKYATTLAALGGREFASAFEIGCSIGVLTERLAPSCGALLAVDVAEAALDRARRRCAALPQVRFARMRVPADWPSGSFDLILLSEVLYFLDAAAVAGTAGRVLGALAPGGMVLLVNWLGDTDQSLSGQAAATRFIAACNGKLRHDRPASTDKYRIDRLQA